MRGENHGKKLFFLSEDFIVPRNKVRIQIGVTDESGQLGKTSSRDVD